MEKISIKQADHHDKDWIVQLYQHNSKQYLHQLNQSQEQGFVQDNPHFDQLVEHWIDLSFIYKAEEEGVPAGFLVLQRRIDPHGPEILQYIQAHEHILILQERPLADLSYAAYGPILVDAKFRGKGIAKALHDRALHDLKTASFDAMIAFIDVDNPVSLKIHDALGMQVLDKVVLASGQFFILGQMA